VEVLGVVATGLGSGRSVAELVAIAQKGRIFSIRWSRGTAGMRSPRTGAVAVTAPQPGPTIASCKAPVTVRRLARHLQARRLPPTAQPQEASLILAGARDRRLKSLAAARRSDLPSWGRLLDAWVHLFRMDPFDSFSFLLRFSPGGGGLVVALLNMRVFAARSTRLPAISARIAPLRAAKPSPGRQARPA
jgi:hypothetical protein